VPEGNLANGLGVLADEVGCRELGRNDFDALTAALERREKEPPATENLRAHAAFWSALYPGHPYGKVDSDVAALRKLDRAAGNAFLSAHYRPDATTAVVVSARPASQVGPLVEEYFGGWKAGPGQRLTPPPVPPGPPQRSVRVHDYPRATQTRVRIGCRLPPMTAEALPAYDVLVGLLRDQVGELRESWGATYGMQVSVGSWPGSAHLIIDGAVATPKTGAAVRRLLTLLEANAGAGPDVKTFLVARWDVARAFNLRFASGDSVAGAVLHAAREGWPATVWDDYPQRLANAGRNDVRNLLAGCAGREVVMLFGDAATVSTQLQAQGVR
jgi:zinc protease